MVTVNNECTSSVGASEDVTNKAIDSIQEAWKLRQYGNSLLVNESIY